MSGPSASWFAISGGGMLVGVIVLLFDGVYWPLLLLSLVGFCFWKAWRARRATRPPVTLERSSHATPRARRRLDAVSAMARRVALVSS
jgi:hypothetical protein